MELNNDQQDALIEICNIGMSKAAKQLSILLDSSIDISIPAIQLAKLSSLSSQELGTNQDLLSFVYQDTLGDIEGRSILIFKTDQTKDLTDAVIGNVAQLSDKEEKLYQQEAMVEIGNIIISSCVAAITNMLSLKANLNIPKYLEYEKEAVNTDSLYSFNGRFSNTFVIRTHLKTIKESISGNLLLVLTEDSVKLLLEKTEDMLESI